MASGANRRKGEGRRRGREGDPLSEIGFASYTAREGSLETKERKEKL